MSKYPFVRVVLAFVFSPCVGGVVLGAVMFFPAPQDSYLFLGEDLNLWEFMRFCLLWILITSVFAVAYQFIPAVILALICTSIRLQRGLVSCCFVSIGGGLLAFFWTCILSDTTYSSLNTEDMRGYVLWNLPAKSLILGAFCAALTAVFFLPSSTTDSYEKKCQTNSKKNEARPGRVLLAFALMPIWAGCILGVSAIINCVDADFYVKNGVFDIIFFHSALLSFATVFALFFCVIPTCGLGLIFVVLRFKRVWLSYIAVAWISGTVMFLWVYQIFGFGEIALPTYFDAMYPYPLVALPLQVMLVFGFVAWVTALLVLPERAVKQRTVS